MVKKQLIAATTVASILLTTACSGEPDEDKKVKEEIEQTVEEKKKNTIEEEAAEVSKKTEETEEETIQEPLYQVNEANWKIEPINDANSKVALLTIDDAPDKHTLEMAKTLKELNAPAIFFVNGHFLDTDEEKQVLKDIYELGFSIGNHTYSHSNLRDLSEEKQREEIISLSDLVEEITGERPIFFRAPFGANTDFSTALVAEEGMQLMNWTYGYDWEKDYMNKEAISDIMVNTPLLADGANLLMHDRTWTYEGLSDIVNGLREKGYEVVDPDLIKINASE
ncbi:polysaccharide deacetylase family protein (plasmid) [Rossellomorea sp. AcN35-11]|nr:polysaccharide deacetylase family protein [Rossellomorea aquimaris]WJV32422.1 polysaccharide deacetylase family protein [Rossellomorea sp. AcN35-11]